jgi:hypothetical protein
MRHTGVVEAARQLDPIGHKPHGRGMAPEPVSGHRSVVLVPVGVEDARQVNPLVPLIARLQA